MKVGELKCVLKNLNDDVELEIVYKDNIDGCTVEDLYFFAFANKLNVLYLYSEGMSGDIL